jgi:hypothetical protein
MTAMTHAFLALLLSGSAPSAGKDADTSGTRTPSLESTFSFRGYTWNTSIQEILRDKNVHKVKNASNPPGSRWADIQAAQNDRIANLDCSIDYLFDRTDKLNLIAIHFVNIAEADVATLKDVYMKKYGEPDKVEDNDRDDANDGADAAETSDGKTPPAPAKRGKAVQTGGKGTVKLYWGRGDADITMTIFTERSGIVSHNILRPNFAVNVGYARKPTEEELRKEKEQVEKAGEKI